MQGSTQTGNFSGAVARGRLKERRRHIFGLMTAAVRCGVKILMGFLLSTLTLPFNTVPLGVAVLAGSTEGIPFVLLGTIIGAIIGRTLLGTKSNA